MLYTSYFNNIPNLPSTIIPIAICAKCPDDYSGLHYLKLKPTWEIWQSWTANHNELEYARKFNLDVLSPLDPKLIATELHQMANSDDVALICYENPKQFCHRHLVATWFNNNGIPCKEYR